MNKSQTLMLGVIGILFTSGTLVYAEQYEIPCESRGGIQYICSLFKIQDARISELEDRVSELESMLADPVIVNRDPQVKSPASPPLTSSELVTPIVKCETKIVNGVCVNLDLTINTQQSNDNYLIFGISPFGEVSITVKESGEMVHIDQVTNVDGTYRVNIDSSSWTDGGVYLITVTSPNGDYKNYVINHQS